MVASWWDSFCQDLGMGYIYLGAMIWLIRGKWRKK
jgi:hypothetical protein